MSIFLALSNGRMESACVLEFRCSSWFWKFLFYFKLSDYICGNTCTSSISNSRLLSWSYYWILFLLFILLYLLLLLPLLLWSPLKVIWLGLSFSWFLLEVCCCWGWFLVSLLSYVISWRLLLTISLLLYSYTVFIISAYYIVLYCWIILFFGDLFLTKF